MAQAALIAAFVLTSGVQRSFVERCLQIVHRNPQTKAKAGKDTILKVFYK
jgi:hypothetical protein